MVKYILLNELFQYVHYGKNCNWGTKSWISNNLHKRFRNVYAVLTLRPTEFLLFSTGAAPSICMKHISWVLFTLTGWALSRWNTGISKRPSKIRRRRRMQRLEHKRSSLIEDAFDFCHHTTDLSTLQGG